jgi:FkbM family methyltransferase
MSDYISKIFYYVPENILRQLAGLRQLSKIKQWFLRNGDSLRLMTSEIQKVYEGEKVQFKYCAPVKIALQARKRGVENSLIANSIILLNKFSQNTHKTILDVGSNFGFLSLVWASCEATKGQVYSFEACASISEINSRNINLNNLKRFICHKNFAVGNANEEITLYDYGYSSNVNQMQNSKESKVKMVKLDSFIENESITAVDLIKIDVDGIEYEILLGSQEIIEKFKPILILETNSDIRILDLCKDLGYQVLNNQLDEIKENELPENIFCVHKSHL